MRTGGRGKTGRLVGSDEPLWDRGARLFGILWQVAYAGDDGVTKPTLAKLFRVSLRTIDRDLETLTNATVPLIHTNGLRRGIKGYVQLQPDARPVAEKLVRVYEHQRRVWLSRNGRGAYRERDSA